MKRALIGLVALPLFTGSAFAAGALSDPQLDSVTAGSVPTIPVGLNCGSCNFSFANSSSDNGTTTSSSGSGSITPPSTGGGGGNGGGTGGGSNGGGGSGGGATSVLQLSPAALAQLAAASVTTILH